VTVSAAFKKKEALYTHNDTPTKHSSKKKEVVCEKDLALTYS